MAQFNEEAFHLRQKLIAKSIMEKGDFDNDAINAEVRRQLGDKLTVKENLTAEACNKIQAKSTDNNIIQANRAAAAVLKVLGK